MGAEASCRISNEASGDTGRKLDQENEKPDSN